jgi:hypothetical protein
MGRIELTCSQGQLSIRLIVSSLKPVAQTTCSCGRWSWNEAVMTFEEIQQKYGEHISSVRVFSVILPFPEVRIERETITNATA